mmetsp:Transcript_62665/g.104288  ORF Transcript_62665/g.104288 Transcript_62665/m.104288 type:complete len:211 (-) Transcript_62665:123-755(-)
MSGPKSTAEMSSPRASALKIKSKRTEPKSRELRRSQKGRPDVSGISQPSARASACVVALVSRTRWVLSVIAMTKVGKSAGWEVRCEAIHKKPPNALAGNHKRALAQPKREPLRNMAIGCARLRVSKDSSYKLHPIAANRPACNAGGSKRDTPPLLAPGSNAMIQKRKPAAMLTRALPIKVVARATLGGNPSAATALAVCIAKRERNGITS